MFSFWCCPPTPEEKPILFDLYNRIKLTITGPDEFLNFNYDLDFSHLKKHLTKVKRMHMFWLAELQAEQ